MNRSTAVLVAASCAQPAFAQSSTEIEEVFVFGQHLEESIPLDLQQFGNRVEVISAEQLDLGGFNDTAQALQMQVPGLYLAPKNGAFDYMDCSLQGSRCQDVLWLIDGVRINNRLYNTTAPLDTVPAHMIERIEVLYGGQGIFYGTQSVAGVVNIVTKAVLERPRGATWVSGFDGNDGTHISADYRDERSMITSSSLYASQDEADGFQPYLDSEYQPSGSDRDRGYYDATDGRYQVRVRLQRRFASSRSALPPHGQRSRVCCAVQSGTVIQRARRGSADGQVELLRQRERRPVRQRLQPFLGQPLDALRQRAPTGWVT